MRRSLALHGLVVLFVIILIARCGITKKHWETALSTDTISAYEEFLRKHPKSEFENQAQSRLAIQAYKQFIAENPRSPYVEKDKAIIVEYEADVTGRDIVDALQKGRIEVKTMGSGIETVTLGIKRLVNHPVRVVIPVGTFFVCHGSAQNMVGRREKTIVLSNNDWQTLTVDAACAD
jgi:hypothetical protein